MRVQPFLFSANFTLLMRIDPKYFNVFIGIIAIISVLAILYSTIRYSQNQVRNFEENLTEIRLETLSFKSYSSPDSLRLSDFSNEPLIIHFWSTWSSKSKDVNRFLHRYKTENQNITVIAAVVRDDEEMVREYIRNEPYSFHYVEGTEFYQSLLVPGMPAQILIGKGNSLYDTHIGDDTRVLQEQLNQFLTSEGM
jgi:thiol-disulfide isomerase/thioredoxin